MKKIFLFCTFSLLCICSYSQPALSAKADERIELASAFCMAMHLDGYHAGHNALAYEAYKNDVTECYRRVHSHKLEDIRIALADILGFSDGTYRAIVQDALYWKVENKTVSAAIDPDHRSPLQQLLSENDYQTFVRLISDFYRLSAFNEFYKSHSAVYEKAEQLYNDGVLSHYRPETFDALYGINHLNINVYISLLNGDINYSLPEKRIVVMSGFCSLLGPHYEDMGMILSKFDTTDRLQPLLMCLTDMFLHADISAVEPKVAEYTGVYYKTGMWLFDRNGLSSANVFRAQIATIGALLYFNDRYSQEVQQVIGSQKQMGFVWQNEMWQAVTDQFLGNRAGYATFPEFLSDFLKTYRLILNY